MSALNLTGMVLTRVRDQVERSSVYLLRGPFQLGIGLTVMAALPSTGCSAIVPTFLPAKSDCKYQATLTGPSHTSRGIKARIGMLQSHPRPCFCPTLAAITRNEQGG